MRVALEDIAEINPAPPRGLPGSETVAFVPMASVSETGSMRVLEHKLVSELNGGYSNFRSGDILLAKITPCFENNKIALADIDTDHGFGSTEFHVIRAQTSVLDSRYLINFLRQDALREAGTRRMTGSAGQKRVPRLFLANLMVPLPPINEQRRIAAILDQADDLRRKRRQSLTLLDDFVTSVFIKFFGDPVTNERHWNLLPIGDLDIKIADGNYAEKYPSAADFLDDGVPFVRAENLRDMTIDGSNMRFISIEKHAKLRKGHLHTDDVLITTRGRIGEVALVPASYSGANVNAQIVILRSQSRNITPLYLAHVLRFYRIRSVLQSYQTGVALKQLPIRSLRAIKIPLPPQSDQQRYAQAMAEIHSLKKTTQQSEATLDRLFASLQHRAFDDALRPNLVEATLASV
jgi:type I restriction enzyme S subunit